MIPLSLFVHPAVQAQSVQELIALAKSKPGRVDYASAGGGSPTHMAGAMLKAMAQGGERVRRQDRLTDLRQGRITIERTLIRVRLQA